jgi:hypothetical protein
MSNCYSSFSTTIEELNKKEIEYWENLLNVDEQSEEPVFLGLSIDTFPDYPEYGGRLWLHGDEGLNQETIGAIQYFLKKFRPEDFFHVQISKKIRTDHDFDAFGGEAIFITKDEVKSFSTSEWVFNQMNAFLRKTNE